MWVEEPLHLSSLKNLSKQSPKIEESGELVPYLWSDEPGSFGRPVNIYCQPAAA